jgi:hypothetical protein
MRKAWVVGLLEWGQALFGLGVLGMMVTGLALWIVPGFQSILALGMEACFAASMVGAGILAFPFAVAQIAAIPVPYAALLRVRGLIQRSPRCLCGQHVPPEGGERRVNGTAVARNVCSVFAGTRFHQMKKAPSIGGRSRVHGQISTGAAGLEPATCGYGVRSEPSQSVTTGAHSRVPCQVRGSFHPIPPLDRIGSIESRPVGLQNVCKPPGTSQAKTEVQGRELEQVRPVGRMGSPNTASPLVASRPLVNRGDVIGLGFAVGYPRRIDQRGFPPG